MRKRLFYGTILTAVLVGLSMAAPKPAILQRPGQWTVEVKFEHPQQIVMPWGDNLQSRFGYMILTVTNRTGRDVEFYPKCDLLTDTFQLVPAGRGGLRSRGSKNAPAPRPWGRLWRSSTQPEQAQKRLWNLDLTWTFEKGKRLGISKVSLTACVYWRRGADSNRRI